mgnify:CR=1 FL=1
MFVLFILKNIIHRAGCWSCHDIDAVPLTPTGILQKTTFYDCDTQNSVYNFCYDS